jgi:hypothetical protein
VIDAEDFQIDDQENMLGDSLNVEKPWDALKMIKGDIVS